MIESVIIKPIITEKSSELRSENKYVFKVLASANKIMVAQAVEKAFEVEVDSVRTINVKGKKKRIGKYAGVRPAWKKAIVTLKDGFKIDRFEKLS